MRRRHTAADCLVPYHAVEDRLVWQCACGRRWRFRLRARHGHLAGMWYRTWRRK